MLIDLHRRRRLRRPSTVHSVERRTSLHRLTTTLTTATSAETSLKYTHTDAVRQSAEWLLYNYVFFTPQNWLQSCSLSGLTFIQQISSSSGEMNGSQFQWSIPFCWQPAFNLPRCYWALLNCFQTTKATVHSTERSVATTNMCPCGKWKKMSHVVNSCPQTRLGGGLQLLHSADHVATEWLKTYGL